MTKIKQSRSQLELYLKENVGFLQASQYFFDKGFTAEAKRMATAIRVLLHDTKSSKSLLGQLNLKTIKFCSTVIFRDDPNNLASYSPLICLRAGNNDCTYIANSLTSIDILQKYIEMDFDEWWNEIVIDDRQGGRFSRYDLICFLANKDGGAHVDPKIEVTYVNLSRNNTFGWYTDSGNDSMGESCVMGEVLHTVRQITFEVLLSLSKIDFLNE